MRAAILVPLAAVGALAASAAIATPGDAAHPIVLKMRRGTDVIVVRGVLRQRGPDCCAYEFEARAGQKLVWSESGASVRLVLTFPDGEANGPGFDNPQTLPQTGVYRLDVSPDLMAEGAYGAFTLRLRIPPARN